MKTKKIISVLLTVLLMFSFCSFSVSAADGTGDFSIDDCTVIGTTYTSTGDYTVVSKDFTITDMTSGTYKDMRCYAFPRFSEGEDRSSVMIKVIEDFPVRADHEYNFKFKWAYSYSLECNFIVGLRFVDASNQTLKRQVLFSSTSPGSSKIHSFDLNFTPIVPEDQTGYKCELYIEFNQVAFEGTNPQRFYVSNTLSLTDLDDDTGLINSIIDAIKAIPEKIKGFFTNLADSISGFFQELSDNIKGFFDSLKNYILYFQDPVTLNSEGVLVDAYGEPIYVNPFENSIESIEETFNSWIEDIRSFISGMDESRAEVSGYLQTGTGLINDVLSASPIISAVLIFIASFFVIRKVVGR